MIVESPAKIKTIAAYLGAGWVVEASRGHVRDLPADDLGIDVQHDFTPQYTVLKEKSGVVRRLRKAIQAAEAVYLATDPDREGEAIAWHILELAHKEVKGKAVYRVRFTAITKPAILSAIAQPQALDLALVEAQQTRRVVDRLVGYLVSPLACQTLDNRVSAGRVQSVCLRLVVERERDIAGFVPTPYWTLTARFQAPDSTFDAPLASVQGQKPTLTQAQVNKLVEVLKTAVFWVEAVKQGEQQRQPLPPFTTATLQQAASKVLGLSPERTIAVAQILYEAGLITYMRTDGVAIAPEAAQAARNLILENCGAPYLPAEPPAYETKTRNAQESHEAIRPTDAHRLPEGLPPGDGTALYGLIWKRFIASQMAPARYTLSAARILAGRQMGQAYPLEFQARSRQLRFDGFLKVYEEALDDGETPEPETVLPSLTPQMTLRLVEWLPEGHATKAPARYTEAALIRSLEQRGIGRPSTYATMVKLIKDKGYVRLENKRLVPTETGVKLCDFLLQRFPVIFFFLYTATLEAQLDQVAAGETARLTVLQSFWNERFAAPLKALARETLDRQPKPAPTVVGKCPACGGNLVERQGPNGTFVGCANFPKCKGTASPTRFTAVKGGKRS